MSSVGLTRKKIKHLLEKINLKLAKDNVQGEIFIVGGAAVMSLVFQVSESNNDVGTYFQPTVKIRTAAMQVAEEEQLERHWLNDSVKGFLSEQGTYQSYLKLSHLKIYCAQAEYMFAMKCLAMRIGEEFQDLEDIKYLIRYLGITTYPQALNFIENYYPLQKIPQRTLYALEELIDQQLI